LTLFLLITLIAPSEEIRVLAPIVLSMGLKHHSPMLLISCIDVFPAGSTY